MKTRWFFFFFLISGFCSLVYEVVWLRLAMARFGVTTPMVSIVLSVFMAGWSSRNKYSLLGAMRAIAQMISYEVPLILSAVTVIMAAGSLSTVTKPP